MTICSPKVSYPVMLFLSQRRNSFNALKVITSISISVSIKLSSYNKLDARGWYSTLI